MTTCKSCGKELAKGVKKCIHCGKDQRNFFMRHKIITGIIVLFLIGMFSDTSPKDELHQGVKSEVVEDVDDKVVAKEEEPKEIVDDKEVVKDETKETADEAYQRILEEYTVKIEDATPSLIEEYKSEAKDNTDGLEVLAKLSNEKIMTLAGISNDGVGKMAKVMLKKGNGSYDDYEEWAGKLMDIYMKEASKITDAYMNSAI